MYALASVRQNGATNGRSAATLMPHPLQLRDVGTIVQPATDSLLLRGRAVRMGLHWLLINLPPHDCQRLLIHRGGIPLL